MPSHMKSHNKKGSGQLQRAKGNAKPARGTSAINPKMASKPTGRSKKLSG